MQLELSDGNGATARGSRRGGLLRCRGRKARVTARLKPATATQARRAPPCGEAHGCSGDQGATNGTGGKDSVVEIDAATGAPDSPGSLQLAGDASTLRWTHLMRELPA